jgi:predicted nuclease of predicted toxin-antitoxin system
VNFIIDAQLPFKISQLIKEKGHDVIHTDDLKQKEKTTDNEIRNIAHNENRIVITKDTDFLNSFFLNNNPQRLLIITTGNINNRKLFELVLNNLDKIEELFNECNLVELSNNEIIGHETKY